MPQISDYISLIPSQNASAPKFVATVSLLAQAFIDEQTTLGLIDFDLDTATGTELDIIGQWVGLSRSVSGVTGTALPLYFSFDTADLGFDQGIIYGPYDMPSGIAVMDDSTYRFMLRIKIEANKWDGTMGGLQAIFALLLPTVQTLNTVVDYNNTQVQAYNPAITSPDNLVQLVPGGSYAFVEDNKDMTMSLYLGGTLPSAIILALLAGDYFALRPMGVKLTTFAVSDYNSPFFGFDISNLYVGGFDQSSFAVAL